MIISVAAFADEHIKKELVAFDKIRESISGYKEASRECKIWLYDAIKDRVMCAQKATF